MIQVHYATKKELRNSVGKPLLYTETSMFGLEYRPTGSFCVADGSPKRAWFAVVTMHNGLIRKVS